VSSGIFGGQSHPLPGHEFAQALCRVLSGAGEDICEPGLWVHVVEARRHDEGSMTAVRSAPRSEPANDQARLSSATSTGMTIRYV
jgi:hypothetical protein